MKHLALFNGIGGFQLAASWVGWNNVAHVEIDSFCNRVVAYHFQQSQCFTDIKQFDGKPFRNTIDIISGGFPCQPYSAAGKRLGTADDRHLWPEMLRVISEIQPSWVVGENVRGLTNWNGGLVFDQVQADLEAEGYEVLPFLLPACAVNAPHRRDRIWFIAYSVNNRHKTGRGKEGETDSLSEVGRQAMDSGEFNGASVSSIVANAGLFRQAFNEQQAAGIEQQSERIIIESNWDTDEGFNDPNEHFITHYNIGNGQKDRLQTGWKVDVDSIKRNGIITDTNSSIGREGRMHQTKPKTAERHIGLCDTWADRTDWSNFPTQPPICDRNDGLSGRLVGITFPKWRNESIKALGNSIVPQLAYQIFKAIDEFDKLK